jgi:hypothetical protein
MDDRICGTCRHFEWATQPGRGWCRNPRLFSASQSQPVSEFELSCATRYGDFWEASDELIDGQPLIVVEPDAPVGRSLEYDEHEDPSGGGQMRGSNADQPRSSDDAFSQGDATAPRAPRSPGGERVPPGSGGFAAASSGGGGGDRPPAYQTEERYWTDYLRIALPIAGLLLLLSVFRFWASSFIGGDEDNTPTPIVAVNVTPEGQPTLTPTLAEVQVLNTPTTNAATEPTQPAAQPTQAQTQPTQAPAEPTQPAAQPTETSADASGQFAEGDLVIVNDNDVNMRDQASIDGNVVDTLTQGTELRILSGTPTEAGGYIWWNVSDDALGVEGWVAGDYIDK